MNDYRPRKRVQKPAYSPAASQFLGGFLCLVLLGAFAPLRDPLLSCIQAIPTLREYPGLPYLNLARSRSPSDPDIPEFFRISSRRPNFRRYRPKYSEISPPN